MSATTLYSTPSPTRARRAGLAEIDKDDLRPITPALLRTLGERAMIYAEQWFHAYPETLGCRHPHIDRFDVFCGDCSALTSVRNAAENASVFGSAFALQQLLRGAAISVAQQQAACHGSNRKRRRESSPTHSPSRRA